MLAIYLEMGLYIGITGWICDERRGIELQKIVNKIPLERLMIETDCPYLLPRSLNPKPKSRRNEPKYLPEIVKMIALNTDYSYAEIVDQSTKNAINFFNLSNIKNNL
jgi:TatD DNase family protein